MRSIMLIDKKNKSDYISLLTLRVKILQQNLLAPK